MTTDLTRLLPGTVINIGKEYFFVHRTGLLEIPTKRVLQSWNFSRVVTLPKQSVLPMRVVGKLGFRDGTVIKDVSSGRTYIISLQRRVLVDDPDIFWLHGLTKRDVLRVSAAEAELHQDMNHE